MSPARLFNICIHQVADNIDKVVSLQGLPEDILLELLGIILQKGRLSPAVVSLFADCGHEVIDQVLRVSSRPAGATARHLRKPTQQHGGATAHPACLIPQDLNLRDIPVRVESTTHLWLGQRRLS
jgi:hypothetical protein